MNDVSRLLGTRLEVTEPEAEMTQPDLVGIIESTYLLEQADTSAWIRGILERLAPWLGDGLGLFGFVYSATVDGRVHPGAFATVGCSESQHRVLPRAATLHEPTFLHTAYLDSDCAAATTIPGWEGSEGRQFAVRGGVFDVWMINGRNIENRGCSLFTNRRHPAPPGPDERELFIRIAAHVAAAQRLRERLRVADVTARAEAIIDPDGKIQHALGAAKLGRSREALRDAVLSVDRARGKARKKDPERALSAWKGLVSARWTLIDHFESDGRRYVLAQENEPDPRSGPELSPRERQVLANAALGRSNKEIAYALGLAHSTVRVLLTRAARKLGASARGELVARYQATGEDARKSRQK